MKQQERKDPNEDKNQNKSKIQTSISNLNCSRVNSDIAHTTKSTTRTSNAQCLSLRNELQKERLESSIKLQEKLSDKPNYNGGRQIGVKIAYDYEIADIKMGGKGSANWTKTERKELIESGKIRGTEGHHINSVAENPSLQTNPDNIKFYRSREEHLKKGHNGNWQNPSSGELVDKDKMLVRTNRKRIIANELEGILESMVVSSTTGLVLSISQTCNEEGLSWNSIKKGIKHSLPHIACSCFIGLTSYAISRII